MRITKTLWALKKTESNLHVYEQIVRICPEGDEGKRFEFKFEDGDDRLVRIQEILAQNGYRIWDEQFERQPNEYSIVLDRQYDQGDIEKSDYFCFWISDGATFPEKRNADGFLTVTTDFDDLPPICRIRSRTIVVTSSIRILMEKAFLTHLIFLPIIATGPKAQKFKSCFWELTSHLRLPPLSPQLQLVDGLGGMYVEGKSHACIPKDGFSMPELRYRKSDLSSVEPFDLACTREPIGDKSGDYVASKRFRQFCQASKLRAEWFPVRVDPD